jgi:hypothetical protein
MVHRNGVLSDPSWRCVLRKVGRLPCLQSLRQSGTMVHWRGRTAGLTVMTVAAVLVRRDLKKVGMQWLKGGRYGGSKYMAVMLSIVGVRTI